IVSEKNKHVLVVDNFIFRINKIGTNGRSYWKCLTENCSVRGTTINQELVSIKGLHLHSDDDEKIVNFDLRNLIKRLLVSTPFKPAQEIYDEAINILKETFTNRTLKLDSYHLLIH
ncbi:hypothetical protein DMUE_4515, partial [Dictyocoela muelleri]